MNKCGGSFRCVHGRSDIRCSDDILKMRPWCTNKHNHYADREAVDLLNFEYRFMPHDALGSLWVVSRRVPHFTSFGGSGIGTWGMRRWPR